MFLGWRNKFCENDYTTKFNLQIHFDPYQNTNGTTRKTISEFKWKCKRSGIAKAVMRKKNGSGESSFLTSNYTTKLQSTRQYGIGTKAEVWTHGTRQKTT